MNPTLNTLDREWNATKTSPARLDTLRRWGPLEPAVDGLTDLGHLV